MQTVDGVIPIPQGYIWQQYQQANASSPTLQKIPGVADKDHGTYQSRPYYAFLETAAGPLLISDEGLRATLTYRPGSLFSNTNDKTVTRRGAKFDLSFPNLKQPILGAVLSLNDESCHELSFVVSGTPDGFALLPSGEHPFGIYQVSRAKSTNYMRNAQTWGDVFIHKRFAFDLMLRSFDITKMDMDDFQTTGNPNHLLMTPDGDTKNFEQLGSEIVPYGWLFETRTKGGGKEVSSMISSSSDLMTSMMKDIGFKISGGLSTTIGPVDVSTDFSVANNTAVTDRQEKMAASEVTHTEHKTVITECAYVVDKRNVALNDRGDDGVHAGPKGGFKQAVAELQGELQGLTSGKKTREHWQKTLQDFCRVWGTHYVYAATFGAKGTAVSNFTKTQLKTVIQKQVNVEAAWSASASVNLFGIGAHAKAEGSTKTNEQHASDLQSANDNGFTEFQCVGGGACEKGTPGQGDRVPIYLDLRPISDLMGPPFYTDELTAITLRDEVADAINAYALRAATEKDKEDVIKAVELEFGPCHVTITPEFSALGRVRLIGPDVILPAGSVVVSKNTTRSFEDAKGGDRLGVNGAGGSAIVLFHDAGELRIGYRLRAEAALTSALTGGPGNPLSGEIAASIVPPVTAGWFGNQATLSVTIDPSKAGTTKIGPFIANTRDAQVVHIAQIGGAVTFESSVTVRPVKLTSLLGLTPS